MKEKSYSLALDVEVGDHVPSRESRGRALADAFVGVAIFREHPGDPFIGSKSFASMTADGVNVDDQGNPRDIPPRELFQAWAFLAHTLQDMEGLTTWQRGVATEANRIVAEILEKIKTEKLETCSSPARPPS